MFAADSTKAKARHAALVRDLDIPLPFELREFTARLEHQRNRPIRLRRFSFAAGAPRGVWIGTADADYVFYEQGTTPFDQSFIALHELAHMLLGQPHSTSRGHHSTRTRDSDPFFSAVD